MFVPLLFRLACDLKYASSVCTALRPRVTYAPELAVGPDYEVVTVFVSTNLGASWAAPNHAPAFFPQLFDEACLESVWYGCHILSRLHLPWCAYFHLFTSCTEWEKYVTSVPHPSNLAVFIFNGIN